MQKGVKAKGTKEEKKNEREKKKVSGAKMSSLLRVVAVGDGENDAGMLRAASVGVALANACDETFHRCGRRSLMAM